MRALLLIALLLPGLLLADLPSCTRARCPHCAVEFIARMCPTVCATCPRGGATVAAPAAPQPVQQPPQQQQLFKTVVHPQAAAAQPHQQPQPRAVQQPLPVQPPPVYQNAQVAPPRPAQSGVPIVQSVPQQPKPTSPLYPQQQQLQQPQQPHQQLQQQPLPGPSQIIPPSPAFNPQPLSLPPAPRGIPLPPYSTQQLPQHVQPHPAAQAAPAPTLSAPLPPPQPQQQQQQQQQQSFNGNYAPEQQQRGQQQQGPQQVQPHPQQFFPQQQQQFNAFGQPQQPFQPFPGFPQMPQPFGLPPQNPQQLQQAQAQFQQPFGQHFDLFHPPQNLPGLPPFGAPPGTPPSPQSAAAAAQQNALLNPFAPFLHQSYAAGGVTPDPHHFNPFALPGFTLQPTTTTPPPLQPLPGAPHQTFYDNRQAPPPQFPQQQQQLSTAAQPQQQLQQPHQQFAQQQQNFFAPQPNAFQIYRQQFQPPPMFQMPGLPPMPGFPQIPQPFNAQQPNFIPPSPSAPAQLQQLPAAGPQPAVQQQQVAAPLPAAAAPQPAQQQQLPQISTSIDAAPSTFDKATGNYNEKAGKTSNIAPPKPASPQCPSQPGWGACISKQLANERFRNCCAPLGDGCTPLCDYDATLTNMQLAVLTGRCPLAKVGDVMVCASGYEDATPCCTAYGVFEPGYEHCRPYCNPSAGIPDGGLLSEKYKCLVKLTQIQQCFFVTQRP